MFNKKFWKNYKDFKLYTVDDSQVRNYDLENQDFCLVGTHYQFKKLIPENEIWFSELLNNYEKEIKLKVAIKLIEKVKAGDDFWKTYYSVRNEFEKGIRNDHRQSKQDENPRIRFVQKLENITVYLVDGRIVRDKFDPGFHEGGHGYVYSYVPKNEIWMEDKIVRPNEWDGTLMHEFNEMKLMRDKGLSYNEAHAQVSEQEFKNRKSSNEIKFPKQYEHILDKYNISKEFNKNKSFLLNLDPIPDLIYGIKDKYWFLAEGEGGLYEFENSNYKYRVLVNEEEGADYFEDLINDNGKASLSEVYKNILRVQYDFIIGYLKEEKFLAPHPISKKMTEWEDKYSYIDSVIQSGRQCPEAEPYIMKEPEWAYKYAKDTLKRRWPEAESVIMKSPQWANWTYEYARDVIKGRWSEAEPIIMKSHKNAYWYSKEVIKGRWCEAESIIMKDSEYAYKYARDVIKGRWSEAEPYILKHPAYAYKYAKEFNLKISDGEFIK